MLDNKTYQDTSFSAIPTVRIEVERMKEIIVSQIAHRNDEILRMVNDELTSALSSNTIESLISTQVKDALKRAVSEYFDYDGVGYSTIKNAVFESLDKVFNK